jgi:cytochrome b
MQPTSKRHLCASLSDRFSNSPEFSAKPQNSRKSDEPTIRAWDAPTRAFKWALVLGVAVAYGSTYLDDPQMTLHKIAGYFILSLIIFRIIWGFVGASTARFASFVRGPRAAVGYISDILRGDSRQFIGHNPAGGLMVVALLLLTGVQSLSGLFSSDGVLASGPFADILADDTSSVLTRVHKLGFDLLIAAIVAHVAANIYYQWVKHHPLITAMVTGVKPPAANYADVPAKGGAGALVAWLIFGLTLTAVLGAVWWLSGTLL